MAPDQRMSATSAWRQAAFIMSVCVTAGRRRARVHIAARRGAVMSGARHPGTSLEAGVVARGAARGRAERAHAEGSCRGGTRGGAVCAPGGAARGHWLREGGAALARRWRVRGRKAGRRARRREGDVL